MTTVPRSMRGLLEGQLRYMSQYYEVIAASSDEECFEDMLKEQGVRGKKINMTRKITPWRDLIALIRLIFLFLKEKPDIVHTHTPKAGTLGMMAAWITRVPARLHTVAGLPLLVATGRKRKLLNIVEKITYACATKVYPNSFKLKEIILENKFAPARKLDVIANGSSNGIDTSYFCRTEDLEQKAIEYRQKDVFTFVFVGRIVRDKGINELVQAFCKLYSVNNKVQLILVGPFEKDLDPVLPDVTNNIMHHKGIRYVGSQKDVRPFFMAADLFVFPSYREGFPNVVMQAGALNLPSIVTDINGCNEIIIPHVNGMIIPVRNVSALYESMKYAAENQSMMKKMGENARVLIQERYERKFVWQAIKKEYDEVLKIKKHEF